MKEVFFTFRLVEIAFGLLAFGGHIQGVIISEKMNHIMIFCGTFFGFPYCGIILNIAMFFNNYTPLILELIISLLAFICYIMCSILSMRFAEVDKHLMFLAQTEEYNHEFFEIARFQGALSLVIGLFYLLHFTLAADKFLVRKRHSGHEFDEYMAVKTGKDYVEYKIDMKIMPNKWRDKLIQIKYFDRIFETTSCDCKKKELYFKHDII